MDRKTSIRRLILQPKTRLEKTGRYKSPRPVVRPLYGSIKAGDETFRRHGIFTERIPFNWDMEEREDPNIQISGSALQCYRAICSYKQPAVSELFIPCLPMFAIQ